MNFIRDIEYIIPYLEEMNIKIVANVSWEYMRETFPRFVAVNEALIERWSGEKYSDDNILPLTNFLVDIALMFEKAETVEQLILCFHLFCDKIFEVASESYVKIGLISDEDKYKVIKASKDFYADFNYLIEEVCKQIIEK
jgi:hypothetical protein